MSKKDNREPDCCPYCGKILVDYGFDDVVGKRTWSEITDEIVCESCAKSIRENHEQEQRDNLGVIPPYESGGI